MLLYAAIGGLQPIPGDAKDSGVAAMLVDRTKEADDKPFVYVHQHGGNNGNTIYGRLQFGIRPLDLFPLSKPLTA